MKLQAQQEVVSDTVPFVVAVDSVKDIPSGFEWGLSDVCNGEGLPQRVAVAIGDGAVASL